MKKNIFLFIKGFIIGIANIIPGVSGGTLAITLGIYEELIDCISHLFKNFKKNLKFLIPIMLGAVASLISLSKLISYCLDNFELQSILFFEGLILGGLPLILKKAKIKKFKPKNYLIFIITVALVLGFNFIKGNTASINLQHLTITKEIILFIVGAVTAATMVVPGISGSFVLMVLGFYKPIISTISNITKFDLIGHNLLILVPFGLGVIVGIILIAKLIEYLLNKHENVTYSAILGFIVASVITIMLNVSAFNLFSAGIGLLFMTLGFIIAYKISYLK